MIRGMVDRQLIFNSGLTGHRSRLKPEKSPTLLICKTLSYTILFLLQMQKSWKQRRTVQTAPQQFKHCMVCQAYPLTYLEVRKALLQRFLNRWPNSLNPRICNCQRYQHPTAFVRAMPRNGHRSHR